MNLLKSLFISSFVGWLVFLFVYSLIQIFRGMEPVLSWIGLAITSMAPLGFFVWAFTRKPARTSRHPVGFSALTALGLAITMAMSYRYDQAAGMMHVWAGTTVLGWFTYLRWYSVYTNRDSRKLKTGEQLSQFLLETMSGDIISSASFSGQPHILMFYRGNWCPFCTAQIKELTRSYQQLDELGVKVVLISSQDTSKIEKLANQFNVPFTFLADPGNSAARQLGILQPWGTPFGLQTLGYPADTALPTVIITDKNARILLAHQTDNYRLRPEPELYLQVLQKADSPAQPNSQAPAP